MTSNEKRVMENISSTPPITFAVWISGELFTDVICFAGSNSSNNTDLRLNKYRACMGKRNPQRNNAQYIEGMTIFQKLVMKIKTREKGTWIISVN